MTPSWTLETPLTPHPARDYAVDVLFRRWLGLELLLVRAQRADLSLRRSDAPGELRLTEAILPGAVSPSLATRPLPPWLRPAHSNPPLISPECVATRADPDQITFHADLLGTLFYWLSGWGELASDLRDPHERILAYTCPTGAAGLLEHPSADELADLVYAALLQLWPDTPLPPTARAAIMPSHDVDQPWLLGTLSSAEIFRSARRRLYPDLRPFAALETLSRWSLVRLGLRSADPFHTFPWLMRQSEARGLRSTFYFQAGRTDPQFDHAPDLALPAMRRLLRTIHARGHRIGLHPSYGTFRDGEALKRESTRLREICAAESIHQDLWPCRMHYLRWDVRLTPGLLDDAGLDEDSSLAFADRAGFRRGTARPFPLWCWVKKRPLHIIEQPLVAMEASLLTPAYENLSHHEARERLRYLRATCHEHGGTFTLLWHNSSLRTPADRALYLDALDTLSE